MTTTLTDLIIQTIADKANLLDSFVILYATLAGALHRIIGIEFGESEFDAMGSMLTSQGAHLVHTIVLRYQAALSGSTATATPMPSTIYETPDASKESLNLLTLISELYNAQVVSAKLIYDLIMGFINAEPDDGSVLGERQVEGLLRITKCGCMRCKAVADGVGSGQQLRADDPAVLKDIVTMVQEKTAGKEKSMT